MLMLTGSTTDLQHARGTVTFTSVLQHKARTILWTFSLTDGSKLDTELC